MGFFVQINFDCVKNSIKIFSLNIFYTKKSFYYFAIGGSVIQLISGQNREEKFASVGGWGATRNPMKK